MEDCVAISQLADWIAETPESIGARLAGAQAAQKQTRVTLGVMALISLMMLIVTYNAYLSFDSRWALELRDEPAESLESKNESRGVQENDVGRACRASPQRLGFIAGRDDLARWNSRLC